MAKREKPKTQKGSAGKHPPVEKEDLPSETGFELNQFRLMVEAVIDYAIYMLDPEGRIMTWNQALKG
jgi:hypothetical protein